jgi:hypothetical protein
MEPGAIVQGLSFAPPGRDNRSQGQRPRQSLARSRSIFSSWLSRVLSEGVSDQPTAPAFSASDDEQAVAALRSAFARHSLEVAGPEVVFNPKVALGAAKLLANTSWAFVAHANESELAWEVEPRSPSDHLSADVALRFLLTVFRRSKLRNAESALTRGIKIVLCRWPLTGVLADLEEAPTSELTFDGHRGLQMFYAERLVRFPRAKWIPPEGAAREWVEAVFLQQNKPLPVAIPVEDRAGD